MVGHRLRPLDRIRGDSRFGAIRKLGARAGDGLLFVRALANSLGRTRLGLAVGRGAGGAVQRTRLRRLLREAFRLNRPRLPAGLDLLVAPRGGAPGASLAELAGSLVRLAGQTAAGLAERGGAAENGR
jgi:ribonuclease P protein component